jgi:glycosyltransferase involved in cell wall biosynthesis
MARINVLHVIDKFSMEGKNPSSVALSFRDWSAYYDKDKFNVSFCGLKKPDPGGLMLQDLGNNVFYLNRGKYSLSCVFDLTHLIEQKHIHILHLHGYASANFGRLAAQAKRIPVIVHEHAVLNILPHQYVMDYLLRKKSSRAIAVSRAVKEFMIKGRNVPADRIDIVPNSMVLSRYTNFTTNDILHNKQLFNIPPDYKVVGSLTRLFPLKGNRYFIEAVPHILKKFPRTIFLIVGEGPLRSELQTLVKDLKVEKNVLFTGFVKNGPLMLATLDIKVMPSVMEGCPLALIEALAAGKPIVASAVGGMLEIIKHNETGLLVPPCDPEKLAEAISYFLANESEMKRMGNNARIEAKKFSAENIVNQHQNIYRQVFDEYYKLRNEKLPV